MTVRVQHEVLVKVMLSNFKIGLDVKVLKSFNQVPCGIAIEALVPPVCSNRGGGQSKHGKELRDKNHFDYAAKNKREDTGRKGK